MWCIQLSSLGAQGWEVAVKANVFLSTLCISAPLEKTSPGLLPHHHSLLFSHMLSIKVFGLKMIKNYSLFNVFIPLLHLPCPVSLDLLEV